MRGTEKQIKWAEDLMGKLEKEFADCSQGAPAEISERFDGIKNILSESYAGDVIELLGQNDKNGQEYVKRMITSIMVGGNAAAMKIKKEVFKK